MLQLERAVLVPKVISVRRLGDGGRMLFWLIMLRLVGALDPEKGRAIVGSLLMFCRECVCCTGDD